MAKSLQHSVSQRTRPVEERGKSPATAAKKSVLSWRTSVDSTWAMKRVEVVASAPLAGSGWSGHNV